MERRDLGKDWIFPRKPGTLSTQVRVFSRGPSTTVASPSLHYCRGSSRRRSVILNHLPLVHTMGTSRMVRRVLLAITVFALFLPAQVQPSLMSAVNTDPLTTQNVFATLPPVLQSDLLFEKNNLGQFGTFCYGNGATSAANTCYASPSSGSQTILSQSANQTFT